VVNTSQKDENLIRFLNELFQAAYDAQLPYRKIWKKNWDYYLGNQHEDRPYKKYGNVVTVNKVMTLIDDAVAHQTTSRPQTRRVPISAEGNPEIIQKCDFINQLDPVIWEELKIADQLSFIILLSFLSSSTAFLERYIDPTKMKAFRDMASWRVTP